jgi:hypothetical protein
VGSATLNMCNIAGSSTKARTSPGHCLVTAMPVLAPTLTVPLRSGHLWSIEPHEPGCAGLNNTGFNASLCVGTQACCALGIQASPLVVHYTHQELGLCLRPTGHSKSGELSIKLCHITKRPAEACQDGKYVASLMGGC